jgi:hypothetical protein
MLEPIPFAGYVEIDESFDRTASHMAGKYVSYNEPVAWGMLDKDGGIYDSISPEEHDREEGAYTIPLYTHPVKELTEDTECQYCKQGCIRCDARKLLTDEEITQIAYQTPLQAMTTLDIDCLVVFARAILRKASEK